jgi:hypothetical protein
VLGSFPATVQVSPDGWYAWVVNFNLHGEMVPSSVSVVETSAMVEVARITTCTMPHGSRLNAAGTRHYSACMMDEELVEIDARTFAVSRHFFLTKGREMGMTGAPPVRGAEAHAGHDMGGHGMEPPKPGDVGCSPTWAQPSVGRHARLGRLQQVERARRDRRRVSGRSCGACRRATGSTISR